MKNLLLLLAILLFTNCDSEKDNLCTKTNYENGVVVSVEYVEHGVYIENVKVIQGLYSYYIVKCD